MKMCFAMVVVAFAREHAVEAPPSRAPAPSESASFSWTLPELATGTILSQLALADTDFVFEREPELPLRLDAPELAGTARPGLFTWLRQLRTGRRQMIDASAYYLDLDPHSRYLDRQHGVIFRDPTCWP